MSNTIGQGLKCGERLTFNKHNDHVMHVTISTTCASGIIFKKRTSYRMATASQQFLDCLIDNLILNFRAELSNPATGGQSDGE